MRRDIGRGLLLLVIAATLAVVVWLTGHYQSPSSKSADGSSQQAVNVCRQFVLGRLKAPSTARFTDRFKDSIIPAGDESTALFVDLEVDAQNTFGAMIRSQYLCKVTHYGQGRWHLDHLSEMSR